jgi:hypothetical protein
MAGRKSLREDFKEALWQLQQVGCKVTSGPVASINGGSAALTGPAGEVLKAHAGPYDALVLIGNNAGPLCAAASGKPFVAAE